MNYFINNTAVSNPIRDNRIHEIPSVIERLVLDQGMIDMNRSLARLGRMVILP